jgi:mRNA-degrading endonuclease RelE of RelBE toxin-antitoxin system
MRTTVTLDPDLAKKLKDLAHRRGQSFKQTLNEVVRRGLTAQAERRERAGYVVDPHHGGFRPGIDHGKLNQLVDQLEAEDFVEKAGR